MRIIISYICFSVRQYSFGVLYFIGCNQAVQCSILIVKFAAKSLKFFCNPI